MKFFYAIIFALIASHSVFAQRSVANNWYFGRNAGISFTSGAPTALTDGQLNTAEGCSSISDADGNLLFYSDGTSVWTKNHQLMKYTDGSDANNLKGNPSSTQSGLIVPKPEDDDIYYLFTVTHEGAGDRSLDYYTIDMTRRGGDGEIVGGPVVLTKQDDPDNFVFTDENEMWSEKISAVEGGTDGTVDSCGAIWVVSAAVNAIYAFKVTEDGVETEAVISDAGISLSSRGYLKLSPNGERLALASNANGGRAYLFDFNNATGEATNQRVVHNGSPPMYGVEFSPNSSKLYLTSISPVNIYQLDLLSNDIPSTLKTVFERTTTSFRGALQLAPDGKIYTSFAVSGRPQEEVPSDPDYLGAIENPDDDDVTYTERAVSLNGRKASEGLPPFITSFIVESPPAVIQDVADNNNNITGEEVTVCIGSDRTFRSDKENNNATSYRWIRVDDSDNEIGQPLSDQRDLELIDIQESDEGRYKLEVTIDGCGVTKSIEGIFTLLTTEAPEANDTTYSDCFDPNKTYDLPTLFDAEVLGTQDPTQFEVTYFESEDDANTNANAIDPANNYQLQENQTELWARVQANASSCPSIAKITFDLVRIEVNTQPDPYAVQDTDGNDDGISNNFILSSRDAEILDSADPQTHTITYHETEEDARNAQNPIDKTTNYTNEQPNEDQVWVRVESSDIQDCFAVFSLQLIVSTCPIANDLDPALYCDTDGAGEITINLDDEFRDDILNGQQGDVEVLYFNTLAEAETNDNALPVTYVLTENTSLYTRVHFASDPDNDNCMATAEIPLELSVVDVNLDLNDYQQEDSDGTLDGITNTFELNTQDAQILDGADAGNYRITYYTSQEGAENINDDYLIDKNIAYTNEIANRQTIYVRIESSNNYECYKVTPLDLVVSSCPVAIQPDPLYECAENNDLTFEFDFESTVTSTILNGQSPTEFSVRYYLTQADAETDTNTLSATSYTNINATETIWARVFDNAATADCDPAITSFEIRVVGIIVPEELDNIVRCDESGDGLVTDIDLTQNTEVILANYDISEHANFRISYHFSEGRDATDEIENPESFSNTEAYEQRIYIRVEDATTGECPDLSLWIDIEINQGPEFEVDDFGFCEGDNQIIIAPENPADVYTYEWRKDPDTAVIGTSMQLTVTETGIYQVTATDPETECSNTKSISVQQYVTQEITLNDVRVVDGNVNNTIYIDNFSDDYEFSLEDLEGMVIRDFQDEPVFENVPYGLYMVVVQDKGGCGTSSIEIIVLDIPRFFTPNGDNNNDVWQIKELDLEFFEKTTIYIYDRYGRLLSEISADLQGWDGTYLNKPLPATDYWYSAELLDKYGRIRTLQGHFSLIR